MKSLAVILAGCFLLACSGEEQKVKTSKHVFAKSLKLSNEDADLHMFGKSFFSVPWVEAPSITTARDGLGPLFSANTCKHCHPNNGAGIALTQSGKIHRSLVMRLSQPDNFVENKNGFRADPVYGGQLSFNGTSDTPYEGAVDLSYTNFEVKLKDATTVTMHKPTYRLAKLQYGMLDPKTNVAPHIALALIGLGHIEDIPENEILKNEDIDDKNRDRISGKANWVFNPETNVTELGRFTWKAASATVKHQVANAAHNDMGLSNPLYPKENCTKNQEACLKAPKGGGDLFDLPMHRLDAITYYLKTLKIPAQRETKNFAKGKEVFETLGCVQCHVESFTTKKGVTIHPYSDFLLHDMGKALSDGHKIFKAEANEFRTPPLWGIGLYKKVSGDLNLLHDGRAKSIEEAVLWHGGEAEAQKEAFIALDTKQREALVEFLKGV